MPSSTVFISGASRGIGKAIALKFAKNGYSIAINCKSNAQLLDKVKDKIISYNVNCIALVGDLSDHLVANKLLQKAFDFLGSIDILVNNAGISYIGLLTDMNIHQWNSLIETNLTSLFNCCSFTIPKMLPHQNGRIINISSIWGEIGASCEVAYSASKGGVNSFTKALAKELALSNICVNAIACGVIDTEMNNFLSTNEKNELIKEIPLNRFGDTKEVANLVFYLASDEASYITGQIIRLDGGWI